MISAELQHNPYLLETRVKFNGQSPKINSQIEKYENRLLADWVQRVPQIFYDEMNGYDFDLLFSGTEYDFQGLKQAFASKGVTGEQVRLILRNTLEDSVAKCGEIEEMLQWLRNEKNRQFVFEKFYDANRELFEETFSCVVIRGTEEAADGLSFVIENVNNAGEIAGTNLTYVPVVFVVEENTFQEFRNELIKLLARKDIEQKQLFFYISPAMEPAYVIRFICDLGVEEPQIITGIDDGQVETYIRNYPMVSHVREVIRIAENEIQTIESVLRERNEQSAIKNEEIYREISGIEETIEAIKKGDEYFLNLDNFLGGTGFRDLKAETEGAIRGWKSRKTKIVGEAEIDREAAEYEKELFRYLAEFWRNAEEYYQSEAKRIELEFQNIYLQQPLDSEYKPEREAANMPDKPYLTGVKEALAEQKEERYEGKKDFLDFFRAPAESKEPVFTVTCYYEKWREKAIELIIPAVDQCITECMKKLQDHYEETARTYHEKLLQLYVQTTAQKDIIASQLSEDERRLQTDNNWLTAFKDQLAKIERD